VNPNGRTVSAIRRAAAALWIASVVALLPASAAVAQEPSISWVEGPTTVGLGDSAQMNLSQSLMFANASDTKKIMEAMQNPPGSEVGLIAPKGSLDDWFIVFEYYPIGFIKDEEKTSLDADAILQSIKNGTEVANKWRRDHGYQALNVIGWYEKPHYDAATHNLVWATIAESGGTQVVNYNTRLLGRQGYMSAVLVTDRPQIDAVKREVEQVIGGFSWKTGRSYAEFVPGDKVAEIGLTALIAGGAGAAAAKTGLLAKIWKFLLVGVAVAAGVVWKVVKSLGRRAEV
jgi:uncharacterized membrane-anchored protein